jgi:hypothetical protein
VTEPLVAPFPWQGGKRKAAAKIWEALGPDVNSYIEPFFGSGAVLLGRPGGAGKYETVNDLSGFIANFFRAVRADPLEVARYADTPSGASARICPVTTACTRSAGSYPRSPTVAACTARSPSSTGARASTRRATSTT